MVRLMPSLPGKRGWPPFSLHARLASLGVVFLIQRVWKSTPLRAFVYNLWVPFPVTILFQKNYSVFRGSYRLVPRLLRRITQGWNYRMQLSPPIINFTAQLAMRVGAALMR